MSANQQPIPNILTLELPAPDGIWTPNVVMVSPNGKRQLVNATPEAQAVWTRLAGVRFEAVK